MANELFFALPFTLKWQKNFHSLYPAYRRRQTDIFLVIRLAEGGKQTFIHHINLAGRGKQIFFCSSTSPEKANGLSFAISGLPEEANELLDAPSPIYEEANEFFDAFRGLGRQGMPCLYTIWTWNYMLSRFLLLCNFCLFFPYRFLLYRYVGIWTQHNSQKPDEYEKKLHHYHC